MPIQKIGFTEGLDKDNDLRYLTNAYRDAFNVRITDYANGNSLAISNVKGNTQISYSLPTGHNYVIGSYDDKLGKNVYYFVYNSENTHSILKYDYTNNVVEKVLQGALGFSLIYFIDSVTLLDNRFLIYTDNNKEPRWVDLDDLSKYSDPVVDETLLDIAKPPQTLPCYVKYTTNQEKKYNNLVGKMWQFRTVYVYKDGTRSAFSTISKLALPAVDSQAPYVDNLDISLDNEIVVSVANPPADVSKVEFYAQGVSSDSEKTTNWYLWNEQTRDELLASDSIVYGSGFSDLYFGNDGVYTLADPLDVAQAQTYIPKKARAIEMLYGNRLGIGNFFDGEGISNIDLQCNLTFVQNDVPTVSPAGTTATYANVNLTSPSNFANPTYGITLSNGTSVNGLSTSVTYDNITIGGTPAAFDKITITLTLTYNVFDTSGLVSTTNVDFEFSYLVQTSDIDTDVNISRKNVAQGIANAINSVDTRTSNLGGIVAGTDGAAVVRVYQGQNLANIGTFTAVTTSALKTINVINLSQIQVLPSFKKEATHEFGIEYSDSKGRRSTVITNGQLKKRAPAINGQTTTGTRGRVTATIEIYHTPPSWATHYSIMYSKNLTYDYFLYFIGEVIEETSVGTNVWSVALEDLYRFRFANQGTPIAYSFQEGDIIQFIESVGGTYVKDENPPISILREEGATTARKLYFNYDDTVAPSKPLLTTAKYLFEIRRPKSSVSEKLFYEVGHTYPITNGFHTGNTQNQTASLPAIITLNDVGDVYYKRRNFVEYSGVAASTEFVESQYFSDYYDSAVTSIGRSSVVDNNFKETHRATSIVYSQPYIPNSRINGIATVYDSSIEQQDTMYGSIQKMYQDDRRLIVFQERKVGVIGINQQFLLNGATQTYETDTVLTPIQYYPAEYGIGQNPESFSVYGYRKYFVDTIRGSVLRLSQDGITPISDVNMRGFFNSLFSMIDPQRVRTIYDKNNEELVLMHNEKSFAVNPSFTPETEQTGTTCSVLLSKASFPKLDELLVGGLCLYIKATTEIGTEYIKTIAAITNVTSYNATTWSVSLLFSNLNASSYTIQYLRKCNYNVLTFSEQSGKWVSRWSYEPDWTEECGIGMVSFKDGGVWLHDSNNTRGSFYGTTHDATVTVVANQNPSQPKTFRNIQLESVDIWNSATNGDISTPEGQSSSISDVFFKKLNNQQFAPILRDINTANRATPLFNGNPMTSTVLIVKLNNDDTTASKLFSVGVGYFDVNLSNFNG